MRVKSLVITLLLLSLFVPAAGAIYIPGQEIPDDGLYHILSAGEGTATPAQMPGGYEMPALLPSGLVASGTQSLFAPGFPAQIAIPPALPGTSFGSFPMTSISLPPADSEGNIVIGDTIGHIVSPPTPGYWDNLPNMDLHTNMPMIPAVFG